MYIQLLLILCIDCSYKMLQFIINFKHTELIQWFFVHSISNYFIAKYCINDIILCLNNINTCYLTPWNHNSYNAYYLSLLLHVYHLFLYKITKTDLMHHLVMCGITGPLILYQKTIISSVSLFFMSGLPGMIDYFFLFLVKIGKYNSLKQKQNYINISIWLRSPGCLLSVYLSIPGLIHYYHTCFIDFLILLIMAMLVFWNGQYYLMKTVYDYSIKYNQKV